MRIIINKASRLHTGLAAAVLLLASGASLAQSVVGLTAAPTSTTLPDGQSVPMWGYSCAASATNATCAAANPNAGTAWSPVIITVPYVSSGTSLTIKLTNSLSFPTGGNSIPTSLMIVGQLGGGLGTGFTTTPSPTHATQTVTWPVASANSTNTPTAQPNRVQSFGTEVPAGATTSLVWSNLRPGTYLIESGTHPSIQAPMGLYGILVVTNSATTTAPGYTYNSCAATAPAAGCDSYDANLPVILSEIDPVQNASVDAAVNTAGFSETLPWSGQSGMCGDPSAAGVFNTCYPPTVNYSPRYYLMNGVSFDRTNVGAATAAILAPVAPATSVTPVAGNLLINFVNAGSRMHVPSVVGLPLTLVAEDGNPLPGLPRVQNEVFLSAGKTYDVLVKPQQTPVAAGSSGTPTYTPFTYPLFDRQLSLSTNNQRDGGMTAYIAVAGGSPVGAVGSASNPSVNATGIAANKTYYCAAGSTLSVTDPSLGVLGGSSGANGAALSGTPQLPGQLVFQTNGTFTYAPPATGACGGSFAFTVNGKGTVSGTPFTATIAECDQSASANLPSGCALGKAPVLNNDAYTASNAKYLSINSPGVLLNDSDPSGLPLKVDLSTVTVVTQGLSLQVNPDGSFQATAPSAGTYYFTYNVRNQQQSAGALSGAAAGTPATVSVIFPAGSGLKLSLVDDKDPTIAITDYRWVIEEDDTYWTDPKCQVNTTPRPTDSYGRACPPLPVESVGYNFHTANMKVVATGCVGDLSCENGQTVLSGSAHVSTVCDLGNGLCRTDGSAKERVPLTPDQVYLDPTKHYYISVMPGDAINPTLAGVGGPVQTATGTRPFSPAIDCAHLNNSNVLVPDPAAYVAGAGKCGHNMGGHQIPPQSPTNPVAPSVTIALAETPLPTAQIAVLVYEDDYPLNGENDAGGGVDVLAPNEAGLGSFQIELLDQGGQFGDNNGQPTYDMFNMPLSNSLAGTLDPSTGQNACPITSNPDGIVGMIVTCPTFEADGVTKSPLAGQAVIKNLYPGLYEVAAAPSADRIARGEEWLQTNTLDGGKPHEAFIRPGEPSYFQEFGPGGFHVQMGFANPKIINDRRTNSAGTGLCDPLPNGGGLTCNSTLSGQVHGDHMARTPDERTYDTGSYAAFAFSHCYVSIGIPDQQDFAFAKCDANGNFSFSGLPDGVYKMAVFDQWNDIMLDGLIAAVTVSGNTVVQPTVIQWRTNLYTRTYLDLDGNGIPNRHTDQSGNVIDDEPGLGLLAMDVRYRDGSVGFKASTDANGYASNNEVFPFMNWLVVEPDTTRYKMTGIHVIYDAGGPDDCSTAATSAASQGGYTAKCSASASHLAGTLEQNSVPAALRIPGAVYCLNADCTATGDPELPNGILNGPYYNPTSGTSGPIPAGKTYLSSGRIDPPWMTTEGWQGLLGQHNFIDFGMKPFKAAATTTVNGITTSTPAENGGISGIVAYSSTRPFDDPTLLVQNAWEPLVPNVQVNLYQETVNADGFTTLTLVDSTLTSSWDKWAQGFRTDGSGTGALAQNTDGSANPVTGASNNGYITNMNCPGQDPTSPFFQTLQGSKMWLDTADVNGVKKTLSYDSQFKCFDGWAMMNQIQPAPYDGKYQFPSTVDRNPVTGRPSGTGQTNGVPGAMAGTNCTVCIANPDDGNPMLPAGKYVVEVVVPSGWELVKEEDKNILVGDIFIAPVTQQFGGIGGVFILPDQAAMNSYYNANNAQNPTTTLGVVNLPRSDFNVNSDQVWPCVGEVRTVPDYLSLFPGVKQVAPFAGASRPLCDRKEVVLSDQMSANTKFFIYTKNHIAGHFTGMMTNDMASEFDPFSPQFGEKFGAANLPVNMRDFMGTEMSRVYGDQWGVYNGMYFSTWEVNPPNPTGYAPQMSIACMNDPGPIPDPSGAIDPATGKVAMIVDPAYNPAYSNFCYEQMFMPGMTNYMDTPVTPVMAFADHYNLPDAEYPNGTPMVQRADFKGNSVGGIGPWSQASSGVSTVAVTRTGTGYTASPAVTFTPAGANATATMQVTSVTVANGAGYTSAPAVTFSGGGGMLNNVLYTPKQATGTACLGALAVTQLTGGSGYTAGRGGALTVIFSAPPGNGGQRAEGTATVAGGAISAVTITNGGCGYTSATPISFTVEQRGGRGGANTSASGTASLGLVGVTVITAGSNYIAQPTVTFSTGGASATALLGVNAVTVQAAGTYAAAPTVAFSGASGSGAQANAALGGLTATAGDLTIKAVGDLVVQNPQYTGPSGATAPYNTKSVTRHYGFGSQCSLPLSNCTAPFNVTASSVTVGGLPATITGWADDHITVTIPSTLPNCTLPQYGTTANPVPPSACGEVVITSGNGKQSVSGITVTLGGKTPTVVNAQSPVTTQFGEFYPNPVQTAIDKAAPGDLIILDAGQYKENLIMWKPVRLQGVGAASVTINADAQPAGKMDAWRLRVDCLFGLTVQGWTNPGNASFDSSGTYSCPPSMYFRDDRLPFEGFVGWDASSNGNLAQVLQEPSLMGAYEGAGVTVVGRGIRQPNVSDLWGQGGGAGTYVDGSVYLTGGARDCSTASATLPTQQNGAGDYGTANFQCNPSGIDGVTITNSSQGGGGIYLHGWNNNFQIANNRILANAGTLSGGINVGNGESPPVAVVDNTICGNTGVTPTPLCPPTNTPVVQNAYPGGINFNRPVAGNAVPVLQVGAVIPSQLQPNVHIHHNQVIDNASIGDALFSGSPAGAGGITVSAGSDGYEIDHNWIAGNLTSSDGGGIAHMGVSFNGKIDHNVVLFNEANNPTLSVDGGGIIVMGAQEDRTLISTGQECGGTQDLDCPPGIGDGTGDALVIDSNLILGNSAAYGSGGGLRLRQTNGTEVSTFSADPTQWYGITVTNNIIANNVAGWDGGGVSLQDSFKTVLVNNTIASNDTTASAGVLFKTLGAIDQASPGPGCVPTPDPSQPQAPGCLDPNAPHIPQPAGLVTMENTPNMMASLNGYISPEAVTVFTGEISCPPGFGYGDGVNFSKDSAQSLKNGRCILVSLPKLVNNLFWENRAFHVEMVDSTGTPLKNQGSTTPNGTGLQSQQNIIALLPEFTQKTTGQCMNPVGMKNTDGTDLQLYWDVGVRMDTLPDSNGHALVFSNNSNQGTNTGPVSTGYNLEGAVVLTVDMVATSATYGQVIAAQITDAGGFYTSNPSVTLVGGGGSGAVVTVAVDLNRRSPTFGQLISAAVTNGGSGYTSAPQVTLSGGGIVANSLDNGSIALTAINSIFSDKVNLLNVVQPANNFPNFNVAPTDPNGAGGAGLLVGQYCNGARVPPEQCTSQQGANNQGMCLGFFTPAGISENVGVPQVFRFQSISATATVDEGNNWINMTYGPLTLSRPTATLPVNTPSTAQEQMVSIGAVGGTQGAYSLPSGSPAIDAGSTVAPYGLTTDFYGNPRQSGSHPDIGAVEFQDVNVDLSITKTASAASVTQGAPLTYTLTISNAAGGNAVTGTTVSDTAPAGMTFTNWTCATATGDSCGTSSGSGNVNTTVSLAAGDSAVITVIAATGSASGNVRNTATVTAPAGYNDTNTANNTASVAVNVVAPTPVLTGITPASAAKGANGLQPDAVQVTLTGNYLTGATAVTVSGGGVSCNGIVVSGGTSLTANCSITSNAATGARSVTVTTPFGVSNAEAFTVGAAPTLTPTQAGAFGNQPGGSTTAHTFTFTNPGPGSLSVPAGGVVVANTSGTTLSLATDNCSGKTLGSGGTCTVIVDFIPTTARHQVDLGTVTVTATGAGPVSVILSGG